jgi:phosphate:Na+ symporter
MEAVSNLENIGDIVETNLVVLGYDRIKDGIEISEATQGSSTVSSRRSRGR